MRKLLFLITIILTSTSVVNAQGISIGATGGLTTITGPDAFTKDISEGGAGFSAAPHFGVKGKLSLPVLPLTLTGQVLYTPFSASGEAPVGFASSPAEIETEYSLLIFGVGAEYNFVPGPISPYLALDVFYSKTGDYKTTYKTAASTLENTTGGNSRAGIGVGGGFEFGLLPMIDLDVSAKYNMNNLFGKEDGEDTFSTLNFSATVYLGI